MVATRDRIYQTSDLSGTGRREFINAAQHGTAHLRTPDGDSLVMLRAAQLEHLAAIRDHAVAFLMFDNALTRPRAERRPADFGEWAFLEVFEEDDLQEFRAEINAALMRVASGQDIEILQSLLNDWRRSARTLSDPVARAFLNGRVDESELFEVTRPGANETVGVNEE
ncbi:hypothetical protein [Georgenia sp. AZ-5]|uniref:hypothetical protein n=1 Tax=Georgenia sp. AZ-5 TaxID=3367526 RepID=UPI00375524D8